MVEEVEVQGRIHTHTHTEDKCSKQIWLCHCTLYILAHQHFWGVTLYILNYVSMNVSKEILPRSGRGCSKQWTRAKVDQRCGVARVASQGGGTHIYLKGGIQWRGMDKVLHVHQRMCVCVCGGGHVRSGKYVGGRIWNPRHILKIDQGSYVSRW